MNVEELIRAGNPVASGDLDAGDSPRARAIFSRIPQAPAPGRRPSRPAPRLLLAGLTAAGIAAVVVAVSLPGSSPHPGPARPGSAGRAGRTAAAELRTLALTAAAAPAAYRPGPGQFQYTRSKSMNPDCAVVIGNPREFCADYVQDRQIWIGPDGSGRLDQVGRFAGFPTPGDRANWVAAGRPALSSPPSDQKFGPGGLSNGPVNPLRLPTDSVRLADLLRQRKIEGGPPGPAEDFVQVGDLLRETDAPPALRAALFRVAASIPGVSLVGHVTDRAGRPGVELACTSRAGRGHPAGVRARSELIFDPRTSVLLAEQTELVNPRTGASTATSWTVYLASGVVSSTGFAAPDIGSGVAGRAGS